MTLQTCPKCEGAGKTIRPPWLPFGVNQWSSHTTAPYTCNLCRGVMVVDPDVLCSSTTANQGTTRETSR